MRIGHNIDDTRAVSWESQLAPVRPPRGYLTASPADKHDTSPSLLCDPLTGLVAYPSFEAHLIALLPGLMSGGVHLTIGDVDDLRGYITTAGSSDPTMFGHLAGNDCMRRVGETTRRWEVTALDGWPFAVCATFGGDEVIVAAAGRHYSIFLDAVADLILRIGAAAPRTCSFASATTVPKANSICTAEDTYRRLLYRIDKCLFSWKAAARNAGSILGGALVDMGRLDLSDCVDRGGTLQAGPCRLHGRVK